MALAAQVAPMAVGAPLSAESRAPPRRVLSLLGGATETVCRLGCADLLVGRSHECDWPPSVLRLPAVSGSKINTAGSSLEIDLEVRQFADRKEPVYELRVDDVRRLEADLVIVQDHCRVCAVTPHELAACGELHQLVLKPCTLHDAMGDVQRIADALGVAERGRELHALLSAQLDAVRAAVGSAAGPSAARPRVAVLEWCAPLMGCGYWIPELIDLAGGEPVLAAPPGGKCPTFVCVDAMLEAPPEVVIFALCGFDVLRAARELRGAPATAEVLEKLRSTGASLFVMDGNSLVNRSGPRLVESAEAIAEAVHPHLAGRFGHLGTSHLRSLEEAFATIDVTDAAESAEFLPARFVASAAADAPAAATGVSAPTEPPCAAAVEDMAAVATVVAQLAALARGGRAGVAAAFALNSPANQAQFGGEARNFGAVLQSVAAFAALVGPGAAGTSVAGAPRMGVGTDGGPRATVTVNVAARPDTIAAVLEWTLEREVEEEGSWLTAKVGFACCS